MIHNKIHFLGPKGKQYLSNSVLQVHIKLNDSVFNWFSGKFYAHKRLLQDSLFRALGRAASFPSSLAPPCSLCSHHSCLVAMMMTMILIMWMRLQVVMVLKLWQKLWLGGGISWRGWWQRWWRGWWWWSTCPSPPWTRPAQETHCWWLDPHSNGPHSDWWWWWL